MSSPHVPKLLFSGALLLGLGFLLKSTTKGKANPQPKTNSLPNVEAKGKANPQPKTNSLPNVEAKGKRPSMASSKTIRLKSSDGETFEVEESVALLSQTIKNMIEDGCAKDAIPLPNVTSKILAMIIDYCRMHAYSPKFDNLTANLIAADELRNWDSEFVNVNNSTLLELIFAANYLNINSLLDLTCQTVADMIKGKTPEELRRTFNMKNDFSPEELEEVRRENQWAFE